MQNFRKNFTLIFVAILCFAAAMAIAGAPIFPAEAFAGLGALPLAMSGEMDFKEQFAKLNEVAKAAKDAVENIKAAHKELDGRVQKLHDDLGSGKADAVSKAAFQEAIARVEKSEAALEKANTEITAMVQKQALGLAGKSESKSLGQMAAESAVCKTYKGGYAELCSYAGPLFGKANVTSASTSAGALIQPHRVPGILMSPDVPLTVRDLFTAVSIGSNAIEWVKEKLFTNAAAVQAAEGASKAESALAFEKMTSAVSTIAHWIPASRQVLADAPQLQGIIDGKLRTGLKLKEDAQLLFGDGLGGNLLGLVPQATAYSAVGIPLGATKLDTLRWAFLQVAKAEYPADFAVLSMTDWALIQMQKTTDGAYIFGSPTDGAAPRIWGKRIVESHGLTTTNFLAGSSLAGTIYDREDVTVRVAEQHANFFIQNMVAILCEERLGFTVERPQAIVSGVFA